jgi:hypothetical protein
MIPISKFLDTRCRNLGIPFGYPKESSYPSQFHFHMFDEDNYKGVLIVLIFVVNVMVNIELCHHVMGITIY